MKFTFAPGSTPLPGYTIRRAIHRGGFGEVYYATSDEGRETALKLLQNNLEVELRGVRQCLNLSHPNLVTIFDVKQDPDGDYWIVMEYVPGATLAELIAKSEAGLSNTEAVRWIEGISAAVSHLHSRGLVHRDLKPGNVFVDGETIKVGDVGLSKFIAPSKQSAQTQSVGTVYYMAPEVAQGKYGPAVDQYALGVIAYELLTGRVPFDGESTGEILLKHLTGTPDLAGLPSAVGAVVGRALEKSPDERFASVDQFASAFAAAVSGTDPVSVVEPTPLQQLEGRSSSDGQIAAARQDRSDEYWSDGRKGVLLALAGASLFSMRFTGVRLGVVELAVFGVIAMMLWNKPPAWATSLWHGVARWSTGKVFFVGLIGLFGMNAVGGFPPGAGNAYIVAWLLALVLSSSKKDRIKGTLRRGRLAKTQKTQKVRHVVPARISKPSLADWATASSFAPLVITALTAVSAIAAPDTFLLRSADTDGVPMLLWFGASALIGVWSLLAIGQTLSNDVRSRWHTRMVSGLYGIGVGGVSWAIATWLQVSLPQVSDRSSIIFTELASHSLLDQRSPTLAAFVVFFGSLFFLRSWVRQALPDRDQRLRIGSVVMSVAVAWVASKIFAFPSDWGMLWAAVVSCGLQSVATWSPQQLQLDGPGKQEARA